MMMLWSCNQQFPLTSQTHKVYAELALQCHAKKDGTERLRNPTSNRCRACWLREPDINLDSNVRLFEEDRTENLHAKNSFIKRLATNKKPRWPSSGRFNRFNSKGARCNDKHDHGPSAARLPAHTGFTVRHLR